MSNTRGYVFAVWCDDIRQEIGNKPSFMGVFTGGILLPSVPGVLSRLSVYLWLVMPIEQSIESMDIQVVRDDGFVLAEIKHEGPTTVAGPRPDDALLQQVGLGLSMGAVEIPAGCQWFVVKVKVNGDELESPKLRVTVDPASFATLMHRAAPLQVESPAADL